MNIHESAEDYLERVADACKIEHDVSEESYERIKEVTPPKRAERR